MPLAAGGVEAGALFIELGLVVVGLALLARVGHQIGFPAVPLYLLAGLAFGEGGLLPLDLSQEFVEVGAEIGVILLLFMLGLEYTAAELRASLRAGLGAGVVDAVANFTPGLVAGLLLGLGPLGASLLGGVTYMTSSGIVAKLLEDLDRLGNRETPVILSVLVMEDLAMTVYLPLVAALLVGRGAAMSLVSIGVAVATVLVVLLLSLRYGEPVSQAIESRSDEVVLLTTFGLVLVVAGAAQQLQVSSAVGAFLVGIALSGSVADRARVLLGPLRDLFAAVFFVFFGLRIDPAEIPAVAGLAFALGAVTAATKIAAGWWAAARAGVAVRGRWRAGTSLVPRGEFSIVVAGLAAGTALDARLGPIAATYVLFMAVLGPLLTRFADPVALLVERRRRPGIASSAGAARRRG